MESRDPQPGGLPVRSSRVTPDPPDPYTSFAAFAEACQPRLQRAAYLICGDQHLAEDLLQSALVKVALRWRQLHHGQPGGVPAHDPLPGRGLVVAPAAARVPDGAGARAKDGGRQRRGPAPDHLHAGARPAHAQAARGAGAALLRGLQRGPHRRGARRRRGHGQEPDRGRPAPAAGAGPGVVGPGGGKPEERAPASPAVASEETGLQSEGGRP